MQNEGLRLATGVFRSSPKVSLNVETNVLSLSLSLSLSLPKLPEVTPEDHFRNSSQTHRRVARYLTSGVESGTFKELF